MSFERSNLVCKQISTSNSFDSVRSLIEEQFFERSIQRTSSDQERLVRLCLRKLSDWFLAAPEQIKEIKLKFHSYLLQTPTGLKQKQLIDLILNELKSHASDYLTFLVVDVYEKNYRRLLDELANESDVGYIVHLPDRITNVCMTNAPACFQVKIYFVRLSHYIEEQLVTCHYPNLVARIDTNVNFLCQLVHRAAKLGYTEYIWRPLLKNVFTKKCPTDPLWLRLAQYFLLETMDDVLLYTIQHGNASLLDLFLSDRILHLKSLETYVTDTLLFRKRLPTDDLRTILTYLTMSPNRKEQCFRPCFIRFLQMWSDETFIRFSSNVQHLYICQCISICLSLAKQMEFAQEKDQIIMCILNGIRVHLESTFDYIRRRGQVLGELIVEQMNLFSQSSQLQFDSYDKNHAEVEMLKQLADGTSHQCHDRVLSDDDNDIANGVQHSNEIVVPEVKKPFPSANTVVLRDAPIDDEDDEFQSYDYSHDTVKADAPKPSYIRTCLADLMATEKVPQLEAALQVLPSLLDMYKVECEEVALELVRILLNYNSNFNIDDFQALQLNGLVALCGHYPLLVSDYLCKQFYEKNYTLIQRSLILKTIQETGRKLSELEQLRSKVQQELRVSDTDEESEDDADAWRSIIAERLKLKTRHKFQRRSVKKQAPKENHFGTIVGHFFYPLMAFIDRSTAHLALVDGDQEHLLLCELLACLGRLCIHAQNTFVLVAMIKQFWQVLQSLQQHRDPGVRHAVVYAYACCLVSVGQSCADEDLQVNLIELKQWLDMVIIKDTNTEVQKLARSTRQILLRTLQEITKN